jgi:hypothetical protein
MPSLKNVLFFLAVFIVIALAISLPFYFVGKKSEPATGGGTGGGGYDAGGGGYDAGGGGYDAGGGGYDAGGGGYDNDAGGGGYDAGGGGYDAGGGGDDTGGGYDAGGDGDDTGGTPTPVPSGGFQLAGMRFRLGTASDTGVSTGLVCKDNDQIIIHFRSADSKYVLGTRSDNVFASSVGTHPVPSSSADTLKVVQDIEFVSPGDGNKAHSFENFAYSPVTSDSIFVFAGIRFRRPLGSDGDSRKSHLVGVDNPKVFVSVSRAIESVPNMKSYYQIELDGKPWCILVQSPIESDESLTRTLATKNDARTRKLNWSPGNVAGLKWNSF